jgi:hypothetical protein
LVSFQTPAVTLKDRLFTALRLTHPLRSADMLEALCTPANVQLTAWVLGLWLADGTAGKSDITQIQTQLSNLDRSHTAVVKRLVEWYDIFMFSQQGDVVMVLDDEGELVRIATDAARMDDGNRDHHEPIKIVQHPRVRMDERRTTSGNKIYSVLTGPVLKRVLQSYDDMFTAKCFPRSLLSENFDVRMALLTGMVDGDGCSYHESRKIAINAKERDFMNGLIHLVRGLGFKTGSVTHVSITRDSGETYWGWCICITGVDLPLIRTVLPYKQFDMSGRPIKDQRCDGFTIEQEDHGTYCSFQVDGNGRLLMDDFVVTHGMRV